MKTKHINKIALYFLCFFPLLAQKQLGVANADLQLYRIVNPTVSQEVGVQIGPSQTAIVGSLGQPDHTYILDNGNKNLVYNDGLGVIYHPNHTDNYTGIYLFKANPIHYFFHKKFMLKVGGVLPQELLQQYEYKVYIKGTGQVLTPLQEITTSADKIKAYYWKIVTPQGVLSDWFLEVDVQYGKIIGVFMDEY